MAKSSATYELMVVFSVTKGEEAVQTLWEKFKNMITLHGELGEVDEWGKRKLAYPINDELEGYYVIASFTSEPSFPAELDRVLQITDGVLRSMVTVKQ